MPLPAPAAPLPRTLARDEAYRRLRGWIVEGTLQPGEVLHDQAIAAALGVSRTPVREALRRLEDEGFVETALNRWTRVAPLDLGKAAELYAILEALERLALETAFARLTADDLKVMVEANRLLRRAAGAGDAALADQADEAFHQVWIQRAGNQELIALVARLKTRIRRVELAYFDAAGRARQSCREHAVLVGALRRRALPEALAALQRNWRGSAARLRQLAQQAPAASAPPAGDGSAPRTARRSPHP
jgi:DNA-binding GntR family transcriptional regulator